MRGRRSSASPYYNNRLLVAPASEAVAHVNRTLYSVDPTLQVVDGGDALDLQCIAVTLCVAVVNRLIDALLMVHLAVFQHSEP